MMLKRHVTPQSLLDRVDYAFQPIVNIYSGVVYGYEALIRGVDNAGFASITAFFDQMHHNGILAEIHQLLLIKAHQKFSGLRWSDQVKLFFNIDGRIFGGNYPQAGARLVLPPEIGAPKGTICLEISEQHEICDAKQLIAQLKRFRSSGCRVAVDDFGTGFAGTHILYYAKPEYVKIDRFYIQNIEADSHKRMLASSMVNIAHLMGSLVIAEGVETQTEYYCCKKIGCDLLQGYFVEHPVIELNRLRKSYESVQRYSEKDKRNPHSEDESLIQAEIEYIEPIAHDAAPVSMLETFKKSKKNTFFPVVNRHNEALGIIREETVKEYAYSKYGRYLLSNPTVEHTIEDFMSRIPIVDIHTPVERILESFTAKDDLEGILITNSLKYVGILRAQSLLRIINEKKLARAIDQNPLSKLPGNRLVFEYVSTALQDNSDSYVIVYFDFDNFKVYNDKYGFRQGDRVILLFAELLKARTQFDNRFIGHIGGDDFFMGVKGVPLETMVTEIVKIREKFSSSVESFYDAETLCKGCITGLDRDGQKKCFPLMSISTAVMELPVDIHRIYSPEEIGRIMAGMKKRAKNAPDKLCISTLKHFSNRAIDDTDIRDDDIIEPAHRRARPN